MAIVAKLLWHCKVATSEILEMESNVKTGHNEEIKAIVYESSAEGNNTDEEFSNWLHWHNSSLCHCSSSHHLC